MAGLFYAFAVSVMPGLRTADDQTFIDAMQRINVPLNGALAAAGPPDQLADLTQVRNAFELAWVRWNTVRAVAHTAALGCLIWALVIYGRTRAGV